MLNEELQPSMPRKPNYAYERNARARAKVQKQEDKRRAKLAGKARIESATTSDVEVNDACEAEFDAKD